MNDTQNNLPHPAPSERRICVVIIASREAPPILEATLRRTLASVHKHAVVDVLINGNEDLAKQFGVLMAPLMRANPRTELRLWSISLGDKAHALNTYVHEIWPGDGIAYFVDGYVRPNEDAFRLLEQALKQNPDAWCASGVPSVGHSAKTLRREQITEHGIHGNLFCLGHETMQRLRSSGFRLPLGIYRTDPTIGAAIKYSLDPRSNPWNPGRIAVEENASWETDVKKWWSRSDLQAQIKRRIRQAQGDLENQAVKHHLAEKKRLPEEMPDTVLELVQTWIHEDPSEARKLLGNPLRRYAYGQLCHPKDWSLAALPPDRIELPI
jgi:hypothetical protein